MSVRTQSAIVGACVFGTSDGFTIRGLGCLAAETPELRRELDMQSYKVEREEAFWFCLPVWVDKVEARLIGKTNYAVDLSHRHGNAGAAVVAPVGSFAKAGFSGAMRYAEDLHERFLRTCLDARSQVLSFQRAAEALRPLAFLQPSSPRLSFVGKRPQRLKLPHSWPAYVSMPELFRLAMSAEALQPADSDGFVLREVDSAQADIRVEEALLASWYDALYGSDQRERLERERDEARNAWRSEQIRRTELERTVATNETRLQGALQTVDSLKATERDLQKQIKETTEAGAVQLRRAQTTIDSLKDTQARFEEDKQEYLSRIKGWERAHKSEEQTRLKLQDELRSWHEAHDALAVSDPSTAARFSDLVRGKKRPTPPDPGWRRIATMLAGIGLLFVGVMLGHRLANDWSSTAKRIDPPPKIAASGSCKLGRGVRDRQVALGDACGRFGSDPKSCIEHQGLLENIRKKLLNCNAARQCPNDYGTLQNADTSMLEYAVDRMLGCLGNAGLLGD